MLLLRFLLTIAMSTTSLYSFDVDVNCAPTSCFTGGRVAVQCVWLWGVSYCRVHFLVLSIANLFGVLLSRKSWILLSHPASPPPHLVTGVRGALLGVIWQLQHLPHYDIRVSKKDMMDPAFKSLSNDSTSTLYFTSHSTVTTITSGHLFLLLLPTPHDFFL